MPFANKVQKYPYLWVGGNDIYAKMICEAVIDEAREIFPDLEFRYVSGLKDILRSNPLVVCGEGAFTGCLYWLAKILNKKVVLYYLPKENLFFEKYSRIAKLIISSCEEEEKDCYPSPVLLSDIPTQKYIERVWKKEKLLSKRGCLGVIGEFGDEDLKNKLCGALNLLIEDLDLNIVFISLRGEIEKDIISNIKYSANTKYLQGNKYAARDLLGVISKIDFLVASNIEGAECALSLNKPVVGMCNDRRLNRLLNGLTEEEVCFDFAKFSVEELYSKIKVAWVHRTALVEQMQNKVLALRNKAEEGVKRLCKEILEM
jgi:hypothetical protein